MRRILLLIWLGLVAPVGALEGAAQSVPPAPAAVAETGTKSPLFTSRDAFWISGFAAGAILIATFDDDIAVAARDSALQAAPWISTPAAGLRVLGFPGAAVITGGMYAYGRLADRPAIADAGFHSGQAVALAAGLTVVTKAVAGRARPYADPDNPWDFTFFRGVRGDSYQSFPSGHATAAFAAAAALTAEAAHHRPEAQLATGVLLFGTASLVGVSRLYHDVHWASDVVAGAAIGTLAGWKVVRFAHRNPDNIFDRWFLGASVIPAPSGYEVRISVASPF